MARTSIGGLTCAVALLIAGPTMGGYYCLTVNSIGDETDASPGDGLCATAGGDCTFRAAIEESNATPGIAGLESIVFAIPGLGPHTIEPSSPLPIITETLTIDGYSQPGAHPRDDTSGTAATLLIELRGRSAGPGDGLHLLTGDSLVRGLVINEWSGNGIVVDGSNVGIFGNYIGVDVTGTAGTPNGSNGLLLNGNANWIGGYSKSDSNVISGNTAAGIVVEGHSNQIYGNSIGLGADGTQALPNAIGISVRGPSADVGWYLGAFNVISGNTGTGIEILAGASATTVIGNRIGTDETGTLPFGNGGDGIRILGAAGATIKGNDIRLNAGSGIFVEGSDVTIGADFLFDPNEISLNAGNGITIVGPDSRAVVLLNNVIHDNGGLGIDLAGDGPTPNDLLDADEGPNGLQNAPVITAMQVGGGSTIITGYLGSAPGTYRVTFFESEACEDPDHVAAERLLGWHDLAIEESGIAFFAVSGGELPIGIGITAIAEAASGNTSELAPCVAAVAAPTTTTSVTTTSTTTTLATTTTTSTTVTTTLPDPCPGWRNRLARAAVLLVGNDCPARAPVVHHLLRRVIKTLHPKNLEVVCPPKRLAAAERLIARVERLFATPCEKRPVRRQR